MITLTLIFCLQSKALSCITKDYHPPVGTSQMACLVGAQQTASVFIHDNPEYVLSTFRCKIENRPERAA
jgi:hypothetical protein